MDPKNRQKAHFQRGIAALSLCLFMAQSAIWPLPEIQNPKKTVFTLRLPPELGTVEEIFFPSLRESVNAPLVIQIQDAHSSPEAQEKIRDLLKYFESAKGNPWIGEKERSVALEGSAGRLHPEYLDLFPDYPKANEAVIQELTRRGILSGTELYVLGKNPGVQSLPVKGVEDPRLYYQNLQAYRSLLQNGTEISKLLQNFRSRLQARQSKVFNPDLKKFVRETERRKEGRFGGGIESPNLAAYLRFLAQAAIDHLQIDLQDRIEQIRFPNVTRILFLMRTEGKLPGRYQRILQSQMTPAGLHEEIGRLERGILEQLIRSGEERFLMEVLNDFQLLEKLLHLELTREDYETVLESKNAVHPLRLGKKLGLEVSKKDESHCRKALRFYRLAVRRDQALLENSIESNPKGLIFLIAGGFHTGGLQSLMRKKNIPFFVVSPRLFKGDFNETLYRQLMLGKTGHLAWARLLEDAGIRSEMVGGPGETVRIISPLVSQIGEEMLGKAYGLAKEKQKSIAQDALDQWVRREARSEAGVSVPETRSAKTFSTLQLGLLTALTRLNDADWDNHVDVVTLALELEKKMTDILGPRILYSFPEFGTWEDSAALEGFTVKAGEYLFEILMVPHKRQEPPGYGIHINQTLKTQRQAEAEGVAEMPVSEEEEFTPLLEIPIVPLHENEAVTFVGEPQSRLDETRHAITVRQEILFRPRVRPLYQLFAWRPEHWKRPDAQWKLEEVNIVQEGPRTYIEWRIPRLSHRLTYSFVAVYQPGPMSLRRLSREVTRRETGPSAKILKQRIWAGEGRHFEIDPARLSFSPETGLLKELNERPLEKRISRLLSLIFRQENARARKVLSYLFSRDLAQFRDQPNALRALASGLASMKKDQAHAHFVHSEGRGTLYAVMAFIAFLTPENLSRLKDWDTAMHEKLLSITHNEKLRIFFREAEIQILQSDDPLGIALSRTFVDAPGKPRTVIFPIYFGNFPNRDDGKAWFKVFPSRLSQPIIDNSQSTYYQIFAHDLEEAGVLYKSFHPAQELWDGWSIGVPVVPGSVDRSGFRQHGLHFQVNEPLEVKAAEREMRLGNPETHFETLQQLEKIQGILHALLKELNEQEIYFRITGGAEDSQPENVPLAVKGENRDQIYPFFSRYAGDTFRLAASSPKWRPETLDRALQLVQQALSFSHAFPGSLDKELLSAVHEFLTEKAKLLPAFDHSGNWGKAFVQIEKAPFSMPDQFKNISDNIFAKRIRALHQILPTPFLVLLEISPSQPMDFRLDKIFQLERRLPFFVLLPRFLTKPSDPRFPYFRRGASLDFALQAPLAESRVEAVAELFRESLEKQWVDEDFRYRLQMLKANWEIEDKSKKEYDELRHVSETPPSEYLPARIGYSFRYLHPGPVSPFRDVLTQVLQDRGYKKSKLMYVDSSLFGRIDIYEPDSQVYGVRPGEVLTFHFRDIEMTRLTGEVLSSGQKSYQLKEWVRTGVAYLFRAEDLGTSIPAAVKLMPHDERDRDPSLELLRNRLAHEARILRELEHERFSPAPKVYDVSMDANRRIVWMAFEWIEGRDLDEWLQEIRTSRDIFDVFEEILKSVGFLHEKGIIHRDLAPGNFRIDRDGRVRILDFEKSHIRNQPSPFSEALPLTGAYGVPPEGIQGELDVLPAYDVFSLGTMLWELASGTETLPEDRTRIEKSLSSDWQPFASIILKATEPEPPNRYSDAAEMLAAFRAARSEARSGPKLDSTWNFKQRFLEAKVPDFKSFRNLPAVQGAFNKLGGFFEIRRLADELGFSIPETQAAVMRILVNEQPVDLKVLETWKSRLGLPAVSGETKIALIYLSEAAFGEIPLLPTIGDTLNSYGNLADAGVVIPSDQFHSFVEGERRKLMAGQKLLESEKLGELVDQILARKPREILFVAASKDTVPAALLQKLRERGIRSDVRTATREALLRANQFYPEIAARIEAFRRELEAIGIAA